MKKILIEVMLGLFLFGVGIKSAQTKEHTKEYSEWRAKVLHDLQLDNRCLDVKNNIKKLADTVKEKYGNNPYDIKTIETYISWLHEKFLILKKDFDLSGIKISDIPFAAVAHDRVSEWFIEELLKATEPLDDLAYIEDKTPDEIKRILSAKLSNVKFLHIAVKNLQNGGDFRKAIKEVEEFSSKFSK